MQLTGMRLTVDLQYEPLGWAAAASYAVCAAPHAPAEARQVAEACLKAYPILRANPAAAAVLREVFDKPADQSPVFGLLVNLAAGETLDGNAQAQPGPGKPPAGPPPARIGRPDAG